MSISAIEKLFRPKSVAIIGASTNPTKTAGRPLRFLREYGFSGKIWPVNPQSSEIDGIRCYASINDLPAAPDASIILLDPSGTEDAVRKLSTLGASASIVLGGGY